MSESYAKKIKRLALTYDRENAYAYSVTHAQAEAFDGNSDTGADDDEEYREANRDDR